MRQCANCGGPFGMVRHYSYSGIGGARQFCCRWCREEYERQRAIERRQKARAKAFDPRLSPSSPASG